MLWGVFVVAAVVGVAIALVRVVPARRRCLELVSGRWNEDIRLAESRLGARLHAARVPAGRVEDHRDAAWWAGLLDLASGASSPAETVRALPVRPGRTRES